MGLQRPKEHETEDQAERIFQSQLPASWVAEPYRKDYGVDFRVDVFEENKKTGLTFGVQLKGTDKPLLISKGMVRFRIEVRHLTDYVDKERQPIYLVVVDVPNEYSYWVFLQRYAIQSLKNTKWRDQKTVTIGIPITNVLTESTILRNDICAADSYMCSMRPGSLPASYAIERNRLLSIDPRFDFQLVSQGDSIGWSLQPKVPIDIKLSINSNNDEAKRKFFDHFQKGLPVEFSSHEISISGSPLFDAKPHKVQLSTLAPHVNVSVEMYRALGGGLKQFICQATGDLTGDRKHAVVTVPFAGSPFDWKFTFNLNESGHTAEAKSSISFNFDSWIGKPVATLPYYHQILELSKAIKDGSDLSITFSIHGNQVFSGQIPNSQIEMLGQISDLLTHIGNLRFIAEKTGLRMLSPEEFQVSDAPEVDELRSLLENSVYGINAPYAQICFSVPRTEASKLLESIKKDEHRSFKLEGPREYLIGGYLLRLKPCSIAFSSMRLECERPITNSENRDSDGDIVEMRAVATSENTIKIDSSSAEFSHEPIATSPTGS